MGEMTSQGLKGLAELRNMLSSSNTTTVISLYKLEIGLDTNTEHFVYFVIPVLYVLTQEMMNWRAYWLLE